MHISQLDHLLLSVNDIDITKDFYIRDPEQNLLEISNRIVI